ncbi:MAG: nucleotide exchange factor GrpE [Burkholderiales bacterium]|nr:nucleotide exchange factor GrpE [Burkholderiales bacterium]
MSDAPPHNDPLHSTQTQGQAQPGDPTQTAGSAATPDAAASQNQEPIDPLTAAQAEVALLQAKVAELQDQFVRGQAEVQNARRRADEEVSKARKFALESFADSLLPVLDSLEAGLAIQSATPEQIREGAEATLRQLKSAMERNKIIAIDPVAGTKFDPAQHQAISVVPAEQEPNSVVSVLQKGYLIAERVLRPALVTVSAPK